MPWLSSPLAATAVVCSILGALAIPLHRLTDGRRDRAAAPAMMTDPGRAEAAHFQGTLRLRLLDPARSVRLGTADGQTLWSARDLEPGEHEIDAEWTLLDDALEIHIEAEFHDHARETAIFLTILPDGLEEITRHTIGSGQLEDMWFFEWNLY